MLSINARKKAKRMEKLQAQKAREANKAADAAKKAFDEAAAAVKGKAKAKEGELSKVWQDDHFWHHGPWFFGKTLGADVVTWLKCIGTNIIQLISLLQQRHIANNKCI